MKRLFGIALAISRLLVLISILISILILIRALGYKELIQIDVCSGMLRTENSFLGIGFNKSQPEETTLSSVLSTSRQHSDWLTVAERRPYSPVQELVAYCYPRLLFEVGAIQRVLVNDQQTEVFANLTLKELADHRDICATTKHLERVWRSIWTSDDPEWREVLTESKIFALWKER